MAGVYDEVEIGDLDFDEEELMYYYPCPCGDKFFIGLEDLWDGEDIAGCPSCTLMIRVLFEEADLPEPVFLAVLRAPLENMMKQ